MQARAVEIIVNAGGITPLWIQVHLDDKMVVDFAT
jgi:hypothetical protein